MIDLERWVPVPGFEEMYEVSDQGRVRSTSASLKGARIRKPRKRSTGYLEVNLWDRSARRYRFLLLQRLVLIAFEGDPPDSLMHAAHIDGDRENNRLNNLRWASAKENAADKKVHGTELIGERANSAKLTEQQVRHIREYRRRHTGHKWGCERLAREFGVSRSAIQRVVSGRWWQHVG